MQLGIFAKTFDRPDVDACLQAVADAGIPATQFNLSVVGLPTIPDDPGAGSGRSSRSGPRPTGAGSPSPPSPAPSTPPTPNRRTGGPTWSGSRTCARPPATCGSR